MTRVQSVNLEWHKLEPGILGIGRHSVSDTGEIVAAFRDNLAPRSYCLSRYVGNGRGEADTEVGATFTMETIRHIELLPQGGLALAITDTDLYFMNTSSVLIDRTTYQPGRGMMFVDIALAASDPRHSFAILSMERTGDNYSVAAAEGTDSLNSLWSKTWMVPVTAIAISQNGEWFASGLGNGGVVLLDRNRQVVWEQLPDTEVEEQRGIASVCADNDGSVTAVDVSGCIRRYASEDGHALWHFLLPHGPRREGVHIQNTVYSVAVDIATRVVAATGVAYGVPRAGKQLVEASYSLIDGDLGNCLWHDRLPSAATGVAVSPNGQFVAVSCRAGDLIELSVRMSAQTGFRATSHQFAIAQAMFDEARAAAEAGQFAEAMPLLEEALALNPTHANATILFDEVTWHLRDTAMSTTTEVTEANLDAVEATLRLMPHDEKLTIRRNALARLLADKWCNEAAEMDEEGREDEAIMLLVRALEHDKNNLEIRMALKGIQDKYIRRMVNESQSLLARQQHQPAIERLEAVRAIRPDEPGIEDRLAYCSAALAFNTGMLQYNMKRYAQAAFQFKKTLMHQKEHAEAARYLRLSEAVLRQTATISATPVSSTATITKKPINDGYDSDPDKTVPPTVPSQPGHGPVGSLGRVFPR